MAFVHDAAGAREARASHPCAGRGKPSSRCALTHTMASHPHLLVGTSPPHKCLKHTVCSHSHDSIPSTFAGRDAASSQMLEAHDGIPCLCVGRAALFVACAAGCMTPIHASSFPHHVSMWMQPHVLLLLLSPGHTSWLLLTGPCRGWNSLAKAGALPTDPRLPDPFAEARMSLPRPGHASQALVAQTMRQPCPMPAGRHPPPDLCLLCKLARAHQRRLPALRGARAARQHWPVRHAAALAVAREAGAHASAQQAVGGSSSGGAAGPQWASALARARCSMILASFRALSRWWYCLLTQRLRAYTCRWPCLPHACWPAAAVQLRMPVAGSLSWPETASSPGGNECPPSERHTGASLSQQAHLRQAQAGWPPRWAMLCTVWSQARALLDTMSGSAAPASPAMCIQGE